MFQHTVSCYQATKSFKGNTCQSRGVNEDCSTKEREVISWVEAVPERTEQEDSERAAISLVDNVTQP